jgi:hypothetical protein
MQKYLISCLALNQTEFFFKAFNNHDVCFIVYDSLSVEFLKQRNANFIFFSRKLSHECLTENKQVDINKFVAHEMLNFSNRSEHDLKSLYHYVISYLSSKNMKDLIVIQELGGFVVNKAIFDYACQHSFSHYFIEPSFFKGYLFFSKNSFYFDNLLKSDVKYIDNVKIPFNIPQKDARHFRNPLNKLVSVHSFKRLFLKIWHIYIRKFDFYFDDFFGHVISHLGFFYNSLILKSKYVSDLHGVKENSIFFPLHVPGDAALTIRESDFLNQLDTLELLLKENNDRFFYVKEHPARVGSSDVNKILHLLAFYQNLKILDPNITVNELSKNINYAVVVNSKAGAEFLKNGKGVYVFGNVYYKHFVNARILDSYKLYYFDFIENVEADFEILMQRSHPGELYVNADSNVNEFRKVIEKLC